MHYHVRWMDRCKELNHHKFPCLLPTQGTIFLRSCDASDMAKDANLLFHLLNEVVEHVGAANGVQVITDNASNYALAGKMLRGKT